MTMTTAEQFAALYAIEKAASRRRAELTAQVLDDYRTTHARDWTTPYGGVVIKGADARSTVEVGDHAALLAWVQEHAPTEVEVVVTDPVTRVRPAYVTQLLDRLVIEQHEELDGTDVDILVDTKTAERVEWARVLPPKPPTVSMHGGKDDAAVLTRLNAEKAFDEGLLDLIAAGGAR